MSHEMFDTLAAGYALGALDRDDLAQFDEHMAQGCDRCAALLRDSQEALVILAREAPSTIPPASVKQALVARIATEQGRSDAPPAPIASELVASARRVAPRARWVPWVAGAAAAVAAAFFTGMYVAARYEAELGRMAREASAQRQRVQRDESALRDQLAAASRLLELIRDPATHVVVLRGTGPSPEASGRVVWHERAGGHVFVANLPPASQGKTYELWTITAGTPRPAGLLQVDAAGNASQPVEPVAGDGPVDAFAVTLEPAGGVSAPTGPIVLASR
jgi:anti-sigma-K factor RskA